MTTLTAPPPAPTGPPPQLSPTKRKALRGSLIAVAAVLVTGSVAALAFAAWGVSTVRIVSERHDLPPAMRALDIDTADVSAAVRITTDRDARTPYVTMRLATARGAGDAPGLTVTPQGDRTRLAVESGAGSVLAWAGGAEITVTLPPAQARGLTVRTQQDTGMLVADADLDTLIARSTDGPIVLSGAVRSAEVQTVDGDISSHGPIAVTERLTATTSDGDIRVDFRGSPPPTVQATSRDGDVALGVPGRGPYLVQARSEGPARIQVPETTDAAAAAAVITATSQSGDVVVEDVRTGGVGRHHE